MRLIERYSRRIPALLLALAMLMGMTFCPVARAEEDGMVRVKLTRLGAPSTLEMRADCEYTFYADGAIRIPAGTPMRVTARDGQLTLAIAQKTLPLGASVTMIRSQSGNFGVSFSEPALSNRFCGDLTLTASDNVITAILNIYIENYLYGVVGYEMAPSSGLEALKAQAVAARNYAMRQKASRSGAAYDVSDAGVDQTFKGYSSDAAYQNVERAVDATRGNLLYYSGKLANCYYCASNGGQTESAANALGEEVPYTQVLDDGYDYEGVGPHKSASVRKDAEGLNSALREALVEGVAAQLAEQGHAVEPSQVRVTGIESVTACDSRFPAPSRLYRSLTFKVSALIAADGASTAVTANVSIPTYDAFEAWYKLSINDQDNETVYVTETERAFEVTFRRSGHGVGLSQRGAQVMAANYGKSCAEILSYYYPGTELRQASLTASATPQAAAQTAAEAALPQSEPIALARLRAAADLRAAAAENAAVAARLASGATVQVYDVADGWAAVNGSGIYGYLPTDALSAYALAGKGVARQPENTFCQVTAAAELRALPDDDADGLLSLSEGDFVQVYAADAQWALVDGPGAVTGFMRVAALRMTGDDTQLSPADNGVVVAGADVYAQLTRSASLQADPSDTSEVLDVLVAGSYVRVHAYNPSWVYVSTMENHTGYVRRGALKPVSAKPDEATDALIDGGAVTRVSGERYAAVSDELLNVYETWSEEGEVLATLAQGERVRVGAYNSKWACVKAGEVTGFVRIDGLSVEAADASAATPVEGGKVKVIKGGRAAVAAADAVPVYASCDVESEVLTLLDKDESVLVGAYNQIWAYVRCDAGEGYVRVDSLVPSAPPTAAEKIHYDRFEAVVVSAGAPVYADRTLDGEILLTLAQNTVVQVGAYNGTCACVEVGGVQGYMALSDLKKWS